MFHRHGENAELVIFHLPSSGTAITDHIIGFNLGKQHAFFGANAIYKRISPQRLAPHPMIVCLSQALCESYPLGCAAFCVITISR
jgi:hypothetical protein